MRYTRFVKNDIKHLSPAEIEAHLALKRSFLRAALTVAGSAGSSPEATKVAGAEAGKLKTEIADLERELEAIAA
jgi:hypothetical protein